MSNENEKKEQADSNNTHIHFVCRIFSTVNRVKIKIQRGATSFFFQVRRGEIKKDKQLCLIDVVLDRYVSFHFKTVKHSSMIRHIFPCIDIKGAS